ncbi:hypothetical protein P186_2497 [Pyrobaculum ferrireducens]|uniref:Uncharacterized protein n=1 Tax=Pyrobaculum ferrireducens TaxID=1104324 RepID=G7VD04_9CREN|nr:hypothetical protein P186_2497 [Pyrobaculum ferrireducens]
MLLLVATATASAQQQEASAGRPVLICVDAGEAGLAGKPPLIAGFVTSRGARQPAQLYINGTVIKTVGIWEANSTKPQVQNLTVLPPVIKGLVCFPPGDPAPAGRGLYIEVEARGRRHGVTIINATEEPAAPPALPLEYTANKFKIVKGRVAARRAIREVATRDSAQIQPLITPQIEPLSLITPGPDLFEGFSGNIAASFKLAQTDHYVLDLTQRGTGEVCARGRFILPNGTSSFILSFTQATRAEVYGDAGCLLLSIKANITDADKGRLLASNLILNGSSMVAPGIHCVPNPPRPWYLAYADLGKWRDWNKRVDLEICVPAGVGGYGRYYIDAFIYAVVPAKSYAEPFAMESPGRGTVVRPPPGASQLYNGTYIAVPGFTPPPGYVWGSARANVVLKTCAPDAPSSVNIYWGPFYIGAVTRTQGIDGCWYYVVTPAMFTGAFDTAVAASLYIGGLIHSIAVGPFTWDVYSSGVTIQQMRIEGLYRPEMNARSSLAFLQYNMNWGTYTLSGFMSIIDHYSGTTYYYGDKVDLKLYAIGDSYYQPQFAISISKYERMQFHCPTVEITVEASSKGAPVALQLMVSMGTYTEGGNSIVDLLVGFISNMVDGSIKWASKALGYISWVAFAVDVVRAASFVGVRVDKIGGDLKYTVSLGSLAPDKIAIDGATLAPAIEHNASVTFIIKQVKMCGVVYGGYSAYLDPTVRLISQSNIHLFRTFTCGKQEIFTNAVYTAHCDSTSYG